MGVLSWLGGLFGAGVDVHREAAARRVMLADGVPDAGQWSLLAREIDAIPTGARLLLESAGLPVILVRGPVSRVAGLEPLPADTKGFTSFCGCVVSLPAAYPHGDRTTSYAAAHEAGHGVSRAPATLTDGIRRGELLSNRPQWRAVCELEGFADPEEAFAEQFSIWCTTERGGFDRTPVRLRVRDYWRAMAADLGWYRNGSLYYPR